MSERHIRAALHPVHATLGNVSHPAFTYVLPDLLESSHSYCANPESCYGKTRRSARKPEGRATANVHGSHIAGALNIVDITHALELYEILHDPAIRGTVPVVVITA